MNDTSNIMRMKMIEEMKKKSGVERLRMGFSMFGMAKRLVIASAGSGDAASLRRHIFLKFYGRDFGPREREKILGRLAQKTGPLMKPSLNPPGQINQMRRLKDLSTF